MEYNVKDGWSLNPNDKVVKSITRLIESNGGECCCNGNPGKNKEDRMCPCKEYRENDHCCCNLYVRMEENTK